MSPQLGFIDDWSTSDNSGSITPDQGQPLSVFRDDCSSELQTKLDQGDIPPQPQIRVSYEPDFSTGSPIAKNVSSVSSMSSAMRTVRTTAGGGPPKRALVRAGKRGAGAPRNKQKKSKPTASKARKKPKKKLRS